MSAQEFKPGDRVRCVKSSATGSTPAVTAGDEYTVAYIDGDYVAVDGQQACWWSADRFELVEPEWVVGQQVSGDDFASLPVGTVVEHHSGVVRTKTADGRWVPEPAHFLKLPDGVMESQRTITHLPDAAEPEDKDDLYVEPVPLKEGDWVQVWAQVKTARPDEHGEFEICLHFQDGGRTAGIFVRPDAIVRPADGATPPWVKPAQCTSLWQDGGRYARCDLNDGHKGDPHGTQAEGWMWTTADEAGRITEGGAS